MMLKSVLINVDGSTPEVGHDCIIRLHRLEVAKVSLASEATPAVPYRAAAGDMRRGQRMISVRMLNRRTVASVLQLLEGR